MNQSTHAWLAIEAYKKVEAESATAAGAAIKLNGFVNLLGEYLNDVVMAAWLPDSLIKDNRTDHIFKNSLYTGTDQMARFTLSKDALAGHLPSDAKTDDIVFPYVDSAWWASPYRVKDGGGHLPARINSLSQTVRDMFLMGDQDVVALTGIKPKAAEPVPDELLYSPRNIATILWMASHYMADAHMPLHCDGRAFGLTSKGSTHLAIEELWGEQVPHLFLKQGELKATREEVLAAAPEPDSEFHDLVFGGSVAQRPNGDVWLDAVYICRASLATSYALVPARTVPVDDPTKLPDSANDTMTLDKILAPGGFCGADRFWEISCVIMQDAVNAVAMLWVDAWVAALHLSKVKAPQPPVPVEH